MYEKSFALLGLYALGQVIVVLFFFMLCFLIIYLTKSR
jgi:hypothetical protein